MSDKDQHWGLNAIGVEAPFEVCLDQRVDGSAWHLQLAYGPMTIVVGLDSPKEVALLLAFMTENYGKTKWRPAKEREHPGVPAGTKLFFEVASMTIKASGDTEARVSKDGEDPDRFMFHVARKGFGFHADLHDPDTSKLMSALRQVAAEMTNG
jgi:hypothetical protein